jgi:uncharacterized protein
MTILTETTAVVDLLREAKTIAVIGFHRDPTKPAHYVPEYLHRQGYKIIPVNPALAERGESYFGNKAVAHLSDIAEPVDVVEIFRRSDKVKDHLEDILGMPSLPGAVWMQEGIRDDAVAARLSLAGMQVVQDRCMLADHRQYL